MPIQIGFAGSPGLADSSPIIGIDLGTTNSLVAYVRGAEPTVLSTREGFHLLPSIVSLVGPEPVVGYGAKRNRVRDAAQTAFSVKRLLGRGLKDVKDADLPYELVESEGGVRVRLGSKTYSAIEISGMILRELKLSAEAALGQAVTRAVITVPAYFNDSQRQATRAAGRLAGLDVLRIINEPTAASLAYGLDKKRQGLIAVYDLGGGTFDISILKLHDGIFEVLATNGDTALGGDDLDQLIAGVSVREIQSSLGVDVLADPQLHARVLEASEVAKIALSTEPTTALEIAVGAQTYRRAWTRAEFEGLVKPLLERTREPCLRALADAGVRADQLSDLVLVGGPTRLTVVQSVARDIFGGLTPNTSMHPDEVVAQGAAIQADILAGHNRDFLLLDVVPLSLGLETYGGLMSPLISRNTRIPAVARESFTTFVDNQTGVDIHVLQGERERVEDNRSLARFKLKGLEPAPAGIPRVEVSFLIDADGILQVSAKDLKTGLGQSIEVRPSFGLTDAEVEKMLMASLENAEQDVQHRKLIDARNEAEPVLRAAEKKMPDAERLLPREDVLRIETRVAGLKTALSGNDVVAIRKAGEELNQATLRLAELLVKEAIVSQSCPK